MFFRLLLAAAVIYVRVDAATLPPPFTEHCIVGEQNLYPPSSDRSVPTYVVDLDQPAEERWNKIASDYAERIRNMTQVLKDFLTPIVGNGFVQWIEDHFGSLDSKLPQPYADELRGIARASEVPLSELVLYNIFYEIFTVCTSIVAQDEQDHVFHARNLDFGLFLGWNPETHNWMITERLRQMVVNVEWKKNNRTLFKSVNFAGYIGIYNGMKPQRFSITVNERFNIDGGYIGIIRWLLGNNSSNWMSWLVRRALEEQDSYEGAVKFLSDTPVMAPVYYIVAGNSSNQGSILVQSREKTVDQVKLDTSAPNGWYILETNYDPKTKPLFIDDRRTPGNVCMQKLGRKNVSFAGLFNVLSSKTTLNKLTAYTTLMRVDTGEMETYVQNCADPCWAF